MPNILITGANRGLGLALAARFARRSGTHVYATVRDAAGGTDLHELRELAALHPGGVEILQADVSRTESIGELAAAVAAAGATLDILINNAGAANWMGLGEIDPRALEEVFRVNAFGPVLVTQALLPRIARGGKIVNVTSVLGSIERADGSGGIAYPMSKAALNMFTRQLAAAVRAEHIAVLALHPGWVRTRMGGDDAALTIDESADGMVRVIDALRFSRSGAYLAYDGSPLPW